VSCGFDVADEWEEQEIGVYSILYSTELISPLPTHEELAYIVAVSAGCDEHVGFT
jgi:hypothetical protein